MSEIEKLFEATKPFRDEINKLRTEVKELTLERNAAWAEKKRNGERAIRAEFQVGVLLRIREAADKYRHLSYHKYGLEVGELYDAFVEFRAAMGDYTKHKTNDPVISDVPRSQNPDIVKKQFPSEKTLELCGGCRSTEHHCYGGKCGCPECF